MTNPVIEREWIGVLRTPKAAALQVLAAVAFSLLVLLRWPTEGQVDLSGSQARPVFQLFGYGLLTTLILLVPAFPAISIVRERLRGTLALLLHTPMTPWSIYLGKLIGVLGFAYLPLIVSLPAAAAYYAMGVASAQDEILTLYLVLAMVTLQYTAVALYVSSMAASIDSALRIAYGSVLVLAILTLAPYQVLQGKPESLELWAATWLRSMSPLPAIMEVLGQGDAGGQGLIAEKGEPFRYALTALVSTLLLAAATIYRLRPTLFDRPRSQGMITDERGRGTRFLRRFLWVVDPQRRSSAIGRFTNPVMIKEFRCRRFGRSYWLLRLAALCAMISLGLTLLSARAALDWTPATISALMVGLQGALIIGLTPSLAAGLISAEIESGGWALLQMTPLSGGRILRGKLLSVAWTLLLILVATLPGYAVMVYAQPSLTQQVGYVLICLGLTSVFALMLTAAVSSVCKRTAAATIASYALLLSICVGTLLFWLGQDTTFGHDLVEKILIINPLAAALNVMEVPGFKNYHLVPTCWWVVGGATLACMIFLRIQVWRLTRPS